MPIFRLLSSGVILAKPIAAVLRWARPTSAVTRVLFLLLGVCLVLGGVGAHQDGRDGWAVGLIAAGLVLALLRRSRSGPIPVARPVQLIPPNASSPSARLRAGWCRSNLAEDCSGKAVFSVSPAAVAWSLLGAIAAVTEINSPEWQRYVGCLEIVLAERYGGDFQGVGKLREWGGVAHRTQAEVVSVAGEAERRLGERS